MKTYRIKWPHKGLLVLVCLVVAISISPLFTPSNGYALYHENEENGPSNAVGIARPAPNVQREEAQSKPQYAPGEIIIKLRTKGNPEALLSQSYSERMRGDTSVLSRVKSRHNLKSEKPVFKGLHNKLKQNDISLQQLRAKTKAESPRTRSRRLEQVQKIDLLPIYVVKTDENVLETCARLNEDPEIEYAEPNYIMEAQMVPDDPYYHSQGSWGQDYDDLWGLKKIECEQAWDISQGEGVVVAVIDSGVYYNHPDLAANIWSNEAELNGDPDVDDDGNGYIDDIRGWDFAYDDNDPDDVYGHGTHCAGTIAATGNNVIGVVGVAPEAKIMAVRGLGDSGSGNTLNLAQAICYAADNGADILSNSWGGGGISDTLEAAFNYAYSLGCVSVASAGNDGRDAKLTTPANIDSVIAVAASTQNDEKCHFSNYGFLIDVTAPGGGYVGELKGGISDSCNIISTVCDNSIIAKQYPNLKVSYGYYRLAGTSMAGPHVAGLAAILKSAYPTDSSDAIRSRIIAGADNIDGLNPGFGQLLGGGRINAMNSLAVDPTIILKVVDIEKNNIAPGAIGTIVFHVKSIWEDADNTVATLTTAHPLVTIQPLSVDFGDILSGQTISNDGDPFVISFDQTISFGESIDF